MTAVEPRIEDVYELTPLQEGMLFHTLYAPDSSAYTIQLDLELEGALDVAALRKAWQAVMARHPPLRTSFVWERVEKPYQVVHREAALAFECDDWSALAPERQAERLDEWLREDRDTPFDLKKAPLMRVACMALAERHHRLVWTFHHIILEGWSATAVLAEAWKAYGDLRSGRAPDLSPATPFVEYVRWLRQQDRDRAQAYWRDALRGLRAATQLPIDRATEQRPAAVRKVDYCGLSLPETTQRALRDFARAQRLTLNTVFQGAWALLLARYTGEDDVTFGAVVSGRPPSLPGAESIVGLFVNTLPARVQVDQEAPLGQWLRQLQLAQAAMREFEYSALVDVQSWSGVPGGHPLFHTVVAFENWLESVAADSGDVRITGRRNIEASDQPLTLFVTLGAAPRVALMYDVERFGRDAVERMLRHYTTLLEGFAAMPGARLGDVPMLPAAERAQVLVEWNRTTTAYPRDRSIKDLFEEQARRTPDAIAIEYGGQPLTYAALDRRANQVAHFLRRLGVGTDTPVATLMERSLEMVVGLLGILKAGGAYLPLDLGNPRSRLEFIVADAASPVLLTQQSLRDRLPAYGGHVVCIDTDAQAIAAQSDASPGVAVKATDLAYIIYTSGSTGLPKGTCIEQRSVVRLVKDTDFIELGPEEVFLQFAPVAFDASTLELWAPLLNGGRLVICPAGPQSLAALARVIREARVSVLWLTAALFNQMVNEQLECLRGVRQLFAGGETLSVDHVRRMLEAMPPTSRLVNGYGPTENTTFTACHSMPGGTSCDGPVPIGRPIANTRIYILDARMQPVPVGVSGELYIGGDGLARGYLNRPDLDAERFVHDPFGDEPGARLYRSGDLARYREDGVIEFLGRMDFQVKIRGFRIEPAEIEAALCRHPAVRETVVIVREDADGTKALAAYVVPRPGSTLSIAEVREHLRAALPEPMVPSMFVMLDAMPITANGKVDRAALPAPDAAPAAASGFVAPRSERERQIAAAWCSVLRLERVSVEENFFDLGGNSLLLLRVHGLLGTATGEAPKVVDLFRFPTIRSLASHLDSARPARDAVQAGKVQEQARKRREALARAAPTPIRGGRT